MATSNSARRPPQAEALPRTPMGYVHPLTPSEILIDITPRGEVVYSGTWEQLKQEGVLTESIQNEKTEGTTDWGWVEGIFWYWLIRHRPAGATSRDGCPRPLDFWRLHVRLAAHQGMGCEPERRYYLQQELERARFNLSLAGELQERFYWRAHWDKSFQALLVQIGATKAPKQRRANTRDLQ